VNPHEATTRVKQAVGREVMLEMYAENGVGVREQGRVPGYKFVSWDGKWESSTRQDLKSLVEEIENEHSCSISEAIGSLK
jgi:hypothetical protein